MSCRKTWDFGKLGNIRKVSKLHIIMPQCAAPPAKMQKLNFPRSALFQMKTRASPKCFVTDCSKNNGSSGQWTHQK